MDRYDYDPNSLPITTAIRVFALGASIRRVLVVNQEIKITQIELDGSETIFIIDKNNKYLAPKSVLLTGEPVDKVCDLWQKLEEAESARCHMPPFGLHFMNGTEIHTIASLCWRCDNIFISAENDSHLLFGFNSQSETGQKLLQLLTKCMESV